MLNRVFSAFRDQGATCAPPTDRRSVELVSSMLAGNHLAAVPPEYAMLLEQANGLVYNAYEFFGTKKFAYQGDFKIPAILDANLDVNGNGEISGRLLLGRGQIELFLYDERLNRYAAVERFTLNPLKDYPDLASLLNTVLTG